MRAHCPRLVACLAFLSVFLSLGGACFADCLECHRLYGGGAPPISVHDPYKEKDCTSCHQEHGKAGELLLVEEGNALCTQCHEPEDEEIRKAHRGFPIAGIPCTSCHHPHASEKKMLLRANIHRPLAFGECKDCHQENGKLRAKAASLLCYRCHEPRKFQGISKHEPVTSGECTSCHDPHGSRFPFLLVSSYPMERYAAFSEKTYMLCFSCHEVSAFSTPGGDAGTAFKNQSDNLHYRHVFKRMGSSTGGASQDGVTCRNCHLPHSSLQARLIREELDCGQGVMCLKLLFKSHEGGGTCAAGCHKTASYGVKKSILAVTTPIVRSAQPTETGSLPAREKSPCLECHQKAWEAFQKANLHDPVKKKRCEDCHLDHGQDNKLLLVGYEGRLCARCHMEKTAAFIKSHGGFDVSDSRCVACHNPHASDEAALLYPLGHDPYKGGSCADCHDSGNESWAIGRPTREVCADCHDAQINHAYIHGAIKKNSCTGCHNPHASGRDKLLVAGNPALCYRCHERLNFSREFRHDPVDSGDCTSCHDVHGSDRPNLLVGAFPQERYREFVSDEYQLCFTCHDESPFTGKDASVTAFRNGEENLHYLHVNPAGEGKKNPGTTCTNCHEPHATDQPLLIRKVLDCGGVPCLNLEFKKIGEGGRCSRGCHTPQAYAP